EDGVICITVTKHKGATSNGQTQIIVEQESDGLVIAEAKYQNSITNWFGLNKPCRVDFTIRVPKTCSVIVNCVSSSASVDGLEGKFDVQGVSGDIKLSNLRGEFYFNNVSGKIIAENLDGPLEMNSVSGKVQIRGSQIPTMIGKTVSGSATIETPLTEGPYEFKSVSGNISLITPEDTACTVFLKSVSGKAKVNLPVTNRSGMRNKQVVEVAGGGPEVIMKSVSGVLKVGLQNDQMVESNSTQKKAEFDTPIKEVMVPEEKNPPVEPAHTAKTQMQILQEIENGKISVDDALKQMNL
ncbi:DUF4097 domain-containing protein, partial [Chloroflexota bacterium]